MPFDDGTVETGYSILEEHQGNGYEQNGFKMRGVAAEPGAVRYELTRGEWEAGRADGNR